MSGLARLPRSGCQSCGKLCLAEELSADNAEVCVGCHREHAAAGELLLQADFRALSHEWFCCPDCSGTGTRDERGFCACHIGQAASAERLRWAEAHFGFRSPVRVAS